ncbi:MAG TPA: peptidoglycan DD-metalloendopeptidase family protein [Candidatus Baltobacteraceae bacterium]|nr:peptidoglycan DD-metalloendopeptidase family protein [Candidatus Baltobacteraceae bacterium]
MKVRSIFCVLLLVFVSAAGAAGAKTSSLQQRIDAQRRKAQALQAKLHAKKAELGMATLRVTSLRAELDQTNAAIGTVNARIGSLSAQENSTQRKVDWNTIQLDAAQRSFKLHDEALRRRLVDIYENGDLSYAAVLLSARSFSEFVERWEDLRLLIDANETAVRERRAAEERVARVQSDLQRTQLELDDEEHAQAQARDQLGALAQERQNLVAIADQQRRRVATEVADMEGLSASEEAQLESLIQEREREEEAQRKAEGIAAPEVTGAARMFDWPVSGPVTSPFGWRSNPFGGAPEFHQGLDIAAPMGTTITASAAGTVIMAQWYGGYGNYILIDDGGGYSTGYGHLSAFYVSVGQQVKQGQAIGAIGCTGECTGPHVHFEIRINGKPVDPAPRLHS